MIVKLSDAYVIEVIVNEKEKDISMKLKTIFIQFGYPVVYQSSTYPVNVDVKTNTNKDIRFVLKKELV